MGRPASWATLPDLIAGEAVLAPESDGHGGPLVSETMQGANPQPLLALPHA